VILGSLKPEQNFKNNFASKTPPEIVVYHFPNNKIAAVILINVSNHFTFAMLLHLGPSFTTQASFVLIVKLYYGIYYCSIN